MIGTDKDQDRMDEMDDRDLDALLAGAFASHPFGDALATRIKREVARRERIDDSGRIAPVLEGPWSWRRLIPAAVAAAALFAVGYTLYTNVDLTPTREAAPQARLASVIGIANDAQLTLRRAAGDSVSLAPGQAFGLVEGDVVLVESLGAVLSFADGTEVRVRPDTTVRVQTFAATADRGAGTGVTIIDGPGEVFCEVQRRPAGNAFLIASAFGTTEVLGTKFGVRVEPGRSVTTVVEGRVKVRDGSGRAVLLGGDEQAVAEPGVLASAKVDARQTLAWAVPAAPTAAPRPPSVVRPAAGPRPAASSSSGGVGLDMPIGPDRDSERD